MSFETRFTADMCSFALRRLIAVAVFGSFACAPGVADAMVRLDIAVTGLGRIGDEMGSALALEGDTALVGAPETFVSSLYPQGTATVYRESSDGWHLEANLVPAQAVPDMGFGYATALGTDLAVVGGSSTLTTFERSGTSWSEVDSFEANVSQGISLSGDTLGAAGVIYVRDGNGWQMQADLQSLIGDSPFVLTDVAVNGDLAVAAAHEFSTFYPPEAVLFFSRSAGVWTNEGSAEDLGGSLDPTLRVSLSADTAVVGSTSASGSSTARVFQRDAATGVWNDRGLLDPGTDLQGELIDVSIEGDVAVIGSPVSGAYTFARTGTTWTRASHFLDPLGQPCLGRVALSGSNLLGGCPDTVSAIGGIGMAKIFSLETDPPTVVASFDQGNAEVGAELGVAVAFSGTTIVASSFVGTPIFENQNGTWVQQTILPLPDGRVARSLAIDGDTFAAGYSSAGVAVYAKSQGSWVQQAFLTGGTTSFSEFGAALALSGDMLIIGDPDPTNPGTCHVYTRTGTTWSEGAVLTPNDSTVGDKFCFSVALDAGTLAVGAPYADMGIETNSGAVDVYIPSGTGWTPRARLVAPIVAADAHFGTSVAVGTDTIVVGAVNGPLEFSTRGDAYVYRRHGSTWSVEADLRNLASDAGASFGYAVAVSSDGDTVYVSAPAFKGYVYVFTYNGTAWSLAATLEGPTLADVPGDRFGYSMSISGGSFAIGAPYDGARGAVYEGSAAPTIFANGFDTP